MPTISAHPARFSPDDKYSRHRVTLKKRFKVLPPTREVPRTANHQLKTMTPRKLLLRSRPLHQQPQQTPLDLDK